MRPPRAWSALERRARRVRVTGEWGFTLIEMLIAMFVLLVGILATIGVFSSSRSTTLVAQRHEVAVHQVQRELEKMRSLSYRELGLNTPAAPTHSSDTANPNNRVYGGNFRVKAGPPPLDEELVLTSSNSNGVVNPGPEPFTVGEGSTAVRGNIYRFVTWRNEDCPAGACDGNRNTKRLIVAITVNALRNLGPRNPVWASSIAIDPNDGLPGANPPASRPPSTSAQNFFLYDKRCASDDATNVYTQPLLSHTTQDTASDRATCENTDLLKRPGLMGPAQPVNSSPPVPPYKYSTDLAGDYQAGLAMVRRGSACPVSTYPTTDAAGKWSLHGWATRKFTQDFNLSGTAFVSLWTTSVGNAPGLGRICMTLVDRRDTGGAPDDVVLGSTTYQLSPWPTTAGGGSCGTADFPCAAQRTFRFSLTGTRVRANSRLLMVLSVLGASDKDLVFLYDDPRYRSFLEVETTTPCEADGTPCLNS